MPDQSFSVMLFAAGFGTRMRPLTLERPKPLIEVAGQPLLDHALALTGAVKPPVTVVNAHYLAQQIIAHCQGKSVSVSLESDQILDTGGGLKSALPVLGSGPVITLNTDAVWHGPNPLIHLLQHWEAARMDALLLCLAPDNAIGRDGPGDFTLDEGGALTRGGSAIYAGAQIIRTDLVATWPEDVFSLNAVWDQMMTQGRAFGTLYPGRWCDVGHPDGITLAEAMLAGADV